MQIVQRVTSVIVSLSASSLSLPLSLQQDRCNICFSYSTTCDSGVGKKQKWEVSVIVMNAKEVVSL